MGFHGNKDVSWFKIGTSSDNIGYNNNDARDMLRDLVDANGHFENFEEETNVNSKDFYKMLDNALEPIYPN